MEAGEPAGVCRHICHPCCGKDALQAVAPVMFGFMYFESQTNWSGKSTTENFLFLFSFISLENDFVTNFEPDRESGLFNSTIVTHAVVTHRVPGATESQSG